MRIVFTLITVFATILSAQNAAVSSYLDPRTSGNADVRIREVRIPSSGYSICTYWCTLGYWTTGNTHGYGGLQWTTDQSQGPKNHIYSQWNDYSTSAYNDPATQVKTFGGEGTGVKSINNDPKHPWATDYWHVTADRVWNEGNNTHFAFIAKDGETGIWRHLMTWRTPEANLKFTGSYCFIEDWRGDGEYRESQIRKGWNRLSSNSEWVPITTYKYDINDNDIKYGGRSYNKRTNWAGGKKSDATGEFFYMGAGGSIACTNNDNTNYTISRTETLPQEEYGIHKISKFSNVILDNNKKLALNWGWDSTTVPQFIYTLTVKDGNSTIIEKTDTIPEKRDDTLDISSLNLDAKLYTVSLEVIDFFDGHANLKTLQIGNGSVNVKSANTYFNNEKVISQEGSCINIRNRDGADNWSVNLFSLNGKKLISINDINGDDLSFDYRKFNISRGLHIFSIGKKNYKYLVK